MARIEVDPNYNSPTFSRATATTDIFKKEDVQSVAAALSTHVHDGTGKGLAIAASGIPANSITSAMIVDGTITSADIADGTIQTADLGLNVAQSVIGQYFAIPTFSSTTTGAWLATPASISVSATGSLICRVSMFTTLQHTAAGALILTGLGIDGAPAASLSLTTIPLASAQMGVSWTYYFTPAAGVHNLSLYVLNNNPGTVSISVSCNTGLYAVEQRR